VSIEASPFTNLTPRECDVAHRLADGKTNREIADELGISIKTVDTHRHHVMQKTGARNNVELAKLAVLHGLVQWPVLTEAEAA
jgi:DNA-binding NarL/FixJ family response regulator